MNRKPKQLQVPLWPDPKDYHGLPPINRDPLVQALWNKTEAEFLAMFELPSSPEDGAPCRRQGTPSTPD